ncbi:15150_t:CDS:2, partial [Cetraspora pellucida]
KENLATSDYNKEVIEIEPESDDEDIMLDYSTSDIESSEEEIFKNIRNHDERFNQIVLYAENDNRLFDSLKILKERKN